MTDASYKQLTRYIHQSGHFSKVNKRVKPNAFLPQAGEVRLSAACIDQLQEPEIWTIGDALATLGSRPAPPARADFAAGILPEARLTIEPDPASHPRHINIAGWPTEKDAQKSIAMFLCDGATLNIRPTDG